MRPSPLYDQLSTKVGEARTLSARFGIAVLLVAAISCSRSGFVDAEPDLSTSQHVLRFVATVGETVPSQSLFLDDASNVSVSWRAETSADWVHVSPAQGVSPSEVLISVDSIGLAPGEHVSAVSFLPLAGHGAGVAVSVELILTAPGWTALQGPLGGSVRSLAVDPGDTEHVLAGTSDGRLLESQDGGSSFFSRDVDLNGWSISALLFQSAGRVFLGLAASGHGQLWTSEDRGRSWTLSPLPHDDITGLAAHPDDPRILMAIGGSMWRTEDGGDTWAEVPVSGEPNFVTALPSTTGGFWVGSSDGDYCVVTGAGVVTLNTGQGSNNLAGVVLGDGRWVMARHYQQIVVSDDQGATWTVSGVGGQNGSYARLTAQGNNVWLGGHAGLYFSEDRADSFTRVEASYRPASEAIYALATHPGGLLAGSSTEGVARHEANGTMSKSMVLAHRVVDLEWSLLTDELVGATFAGGAFRWDRGAGFRGAANNLPGEIAQISLDPRNARHWCVLRQTVSGFGCTHDDGETWDWTPAGLQGYPSVMSRAPDDPDVFWVGSAVYPPSVLGFHRSTDGGHTFAQVMSGPTYRAAAVSSDVALCVNGPDDGMLVRYDAASSTSTQPGSMTGRNRTVLTRTADGSIWYGTTDGDLLRSTDGGVTYHSVGLSNVSHTDVALFTADPSTVYVGDLEGLYVTRDSGATWAQAPSPFPVLSLEAVQATGELYVGTDGGGVYLYVDPDV